jgi:hypothetical protein
MVIGTFLAIPLMFWAFIELWPKTPVGKRLIVTPEKADAYVWSDARNWSGPLARLSMSCCRVGS